MTEVKRPGPPPPPERKHSPPEGFKDKYRKVEKVEKPGEVDPEEKQQRRKFAESDQVEEESKKENELLTPYEALFGKRKTESDIFGRNISEDEEGVRRNYGEPTKSNIASPSFTREKENQDLPTSHQFWDQTSQSEEKKTDGQKKEDDMLAVPEKKKKESYGLPTSGEDKGVKEEDETSPFASLSQKEKEKLEKLEGGKKEVKEIAGAPEKEKKTIKDQKEQEKLAKKEVEEKVRIPSEIREKKQREERAKQKHGNLEGLAKSFAPITFLPEKKQDGATIPIPSSPQTIPAEVISQGVGAASRAASYLSPGVQDLFTQMVSTIIVMQTQGVTTTQVTLSSAAFTNTAFEGATITLQRYATAPDSYNIILSGSNQAVSLFNQNIPALQRAFQQENLPFRVGRLEAEYGEAKPLIRRKKGARDKEDQ